MKKVKPGDRVTVHQSATVHSVQTVDGEIAVLTGGARVHRNHLSPVAADRDPAVLLAEECAAAVNLVRRGLASVEASGSGVRAAKRLADKALEQAALQIGVMLALRRNQL